MASVLMGLPEAGGAATHCADHGGGTAGIAGGRQVRRQLQANSKVQRRRRLPLVGKPQDPALGRLNAILRNPRLGLLGDTAQSDRHIRIIAHLCPRFLADARRCAPSAQNCLGLAFGRTSPTAPVVSL
jgi:hypothetical protein